MSTSFLFILGKMATAGGKKKEKRLKVFHLRWTFSEDDELFFPSVHPMRRAPARGTATANVPTHRREETHAGTLSPRPYRLMS